MIELSIRAKRAQLSPTVVGGDFLCFASLVGFALGAWAALGAFLRSWFCLVPSVSCK